MRLRPFARALDVCVRACFLAVCSFGGLSLGLHFQQKRSGCCRGPAHYFCTEGLGGALCAGVYNCSRMFSCSCGSGDAARGKMQRVCMGALEAVATMPVRHVWLPMAHGACTKTLLPRWGLSCLPMAQAPEPCCHAGGGAACP